MTEHPDHRALMPRVSRVSREGRLFDPSSDRWELNKERTVHLEPVLELLEQDLHEPYRSALEHFARFRSAAHCAGIHEEAKAYLRATRTGRFDEAGLRNYRSQLRRSEEHRLARLRGFLKRWHRLRYHGILEEAVAYLSRIRLAGNEKGRAVKSLDPDKGPFEDNELQAVIEATAAAYERKEIDLGTLAFLMLFTHTGRRAGQLTLMRTGDIKATDSVPGRRSCIVRVPRAKQRGEAPRQSFKAVPITPYLQKILKRWSPSPARPTPGSAH